MDDVPFFKNTEGILRENEEYMWKTEEPGWRRIIALVKKEIVK
jgi:hypothetical protein